MNEWMVEWMKMWVTELKKRLNEKIEWMINDASELWTNTMEDLTVYVSMGKHINNKLAMSTPLERRT